MRRLARWWLRDELLALPDGSSLFYVHDFTGPGYRLTGAQRRRLENHYMALGWAIFAYCAIPEAPLSFCFLRWAGDFFGAAYVIEILLFLLLLLFMWAIKRRLDHFLDGLNTRDPICWDSDLKALKEAVEKSKGVNPLWVPVLLIVSGWCLSAALEIVLLQPAPG